MQQGEDGEPGYPGPHGPPGVKVGNSSHPHFFYCVVLFCLSVVFLVFLNWHVCLPNIDKG